MADKKRINSKHKGSEYERKIAKKLGSWWGEDFHRTPMSGGLHWAEDNRVAGDIVTPPTSVYPWVTELKKREEWEFDHLLKGTGEIEKYWKQVQGDAQRTGMRELLIFSKNFAPDYLMISAYDFRLIMEAKGWIDPRFNYFIVTKVGQDARVVCILDDFIEHVSKGDVIRAFELQVCVKNP
jgi:hypothetical protein